MMISVFLPLDPYSTLLKHPLEVAGLLAGRPATRHLKGRV